MTLRIHRLAVDEIDDEVDYYESRHVGLGAELEDEIDDALTALTKFPLAAPMWKGRPNLRVAMLDRFPFTLPYRLIGGDEIVVLALAHARRRPGYWARRR